MITYMEALSAIAEVAQRNRLDVERVRLERSLGRILASGVRSPEAVPSFDNSAMDGFAVRSIDTREASVESPTRMSVRGIIAAGDRAGLFDQDEERQAFEIMTGAPMPGGGFDAVARIEDVTVTREPNGRAIFIELRRPVRKGENVRLTGTDYTVGQRVLDSGARVTPAHVMACASLGLERLEVRAEPKVAIVSTGSELVGPGHESLEPGMIRNSTGPFLSSALRLIGADIQDLGIVQDDPRRFRARVEAALSAGADVLLSTGAVSMGKYDFVAEVLDQLGARFHFHKAAIRPGKPILFAEIANGGRSMAFFGLPGNPISTAVGLRFFVEPYLRSALGLVPEQGVYAELAGPSVKPGALRCFYKGRSSIREGRLLVEVLKGQASYVVSALAEANCWVVLPEGPESLQAGTPVQVFPLDHGFEGGMFR